MTGGRDLDTALCRSALYEALALGFRPPTPQTVARLANPVGAAGLVAAAEALGDGLGEAAADLIAVAPALAALEAGYTHLFGHTVRGAVPVFETEYGVDDTFRQPHELADLAGFYRAFGLVVSPRHDGRPDHVSCESKFLLFLARKEAVAIERGDDDMRATVRAATRVFLRDHAARFLPAFAARLRRADPTGFYGALARLADTFVRAEGRRFDVDVGAEGLCLRTVADDAGVPMACGGCALAGGENDLPDAD